MNKTVGEKYWEVWLTVALNEFYSTLLSSIYFLNCNILAWIACLCWPLTQLTIHRAHYFHAFVLLCWTSQPSSHKISSSVHWSSPRSLHLSQFGLIFPEPEWLKLNVAFQMRPYQCNKQPCHKSLIWFMLRTHLPIYMPHNTGGLRCLDLSPSLFQLISTLLVAKILSIFSVHELVLSIITLLSLILQLATFCSS